MSLGSDRSPLARNCTPTLHQMSQGNEANTHTADATHLITNRTQALFRGHVLDFVILARAQVSVRWRARGEARRRRERRGHYQKDTRQRSRDVTVRAHHKALGLSDRLRVHRVLDSKRSHLQDEPRSKRSSDPSSRTNATFSKATPDPPNVHCRPSPTHRAIF
jgi:hypothetical protein